MKSAQKSGSHFWTVLNKVEYDRATTGWQDVKFVFAVLPMRSENYFTTIHLVGLRNYPPFNEVLNLQKVLSVIDGKRPSDLRVILEPYRSNSKKVSFENAGDALLVDSQETLIARYLKKNPLNKVFRRIDLDWFYEGIRKSGTSETAVLEKVGFASGEARRPRPAQTIH